MTKINPETVEEFIEVISKLLLKYPNFREITISGNKTNIRITRPEKGNIKNDKGRNK